MGGSTFEPGRLVAVPMASVGNGVVGEEEGGLPGGEGRFPLGERGGGDLFAPADRLPAFLGCVLWAPAGGQSTDQTQDEEEIWGIGWRRYPRDCCLLAQPGVCSIRAVG